MAKKQQKLPFPKTIIEFTQMFPNDEACWRYLVQLRWPEGFVCPYDGTPAKSYIKTRKRWECLEGHQISATTDTVMHKTHTPLLVWFWCAFLMSTKTPGMSAIQLSRQLGERYETIYMIMQKLRAGMVDPDREKLHGHIEVDETFIGGKGKSAGKRGRSYVAGRSIVVGAVEVRRKTLGRIRLRKISTMKQKDLFSFIEQNIEPGSTIYTDDFKGYQNLKQLPYKHRVVKGDTSEEIAKQLSHIHVIFSNLKTFLNGTYHGVSHKHMQAYLNEFVFRFNRRMSPMETFKMLLGISVMVPGPEYEELYKGDWEHMNGVFGRDIW